MALKHVLREAPDVILLGELRDSETIQVVLSIVFLFYSDLPCSM
ncbi:Type II secretion system protein E domain protein [Candidatus Omnitrophus magneticus]|uniref:Type II secretion system protein E domain protein n=1 Tax=Candidatus Omnitrophus magneticus TaxID=1609969 RepID=A0A0F0CMF3_9BACT|nr:Type II secretion system protein E domain protein [Candidatus Omnitrophus magneticus]